jgi:hypothetical protein
MGIFDYLIREVDQEFNLDSKARPLLSRLLGEITDETTGGLAGFLDKFKNVGLGNLVNSWVSSGDPAPLAESQLQSSVGNAWISRLGSLVGLAPAVTGPALSYLVPKVVSALTPDGIIPRFLPDSVREYLGGVQQREGATAVSIVDAPEVVEDPGLRNPLGLLGLAALLGSLAWAFLAPKPPAPVATTRPPAVVERAIAPDYTAVIAESRQKTLQALVSLKPGTYKIVDITNILNGLIINFATNSAEIPAEYTDVLQKSAAAIKSLPAGSVIDVIGHTDSEGDDASNMDLSKRRAEAVAKKLTEYGVDAKSLKAIGYGETKPKGDNSTDQGRFENRRIEFLVIK